MLGSLMHIHMEMMWYFSKRLGHYGEEFELLVMLHLVKFFVTWQRAKREAEGRKLAFDALPRIVSKSPRTDAMGKV